MSVSEKNVHHDLDHLADTWSTEDLVEFEKNTVFFEQIDAIETNEERN